MGCSNPPPLTASSEGQKELTLTSKPSGAIDGGSFIAGLLPDPSLSYTHFPLYDLQDIGQSYLPESKSEDDRLAGHMDLNCSLDSYTDASLVNVKIESAFPRESELSYPEMNMRDLSHGIDGNNIMAADCSRNAAISSTDYQNSEVNMNFMPVPLRGYPMKTRAAEAETSRLNRLEMSGNLSSTEYDASLMPVADNFVKKEIKDGSFLTLEVGGDTAIRSNSKFSQEIASKFPTPGIGDCTEIRSNKISSQEIGNKLEIRSNNRFSTREIANKLEEPVSSQFLGRNPNNSLDSNQLSSSRSLTTAGEQSNSAYNLVGRVSTCEGGLIRGNSARVNSMLPSLQSSLANVHPSLPTPLANVQPNSHAQNLTPSSLPPGGILISHPERATLSTMGPQPPKPTYLVSQPMPNWQQDYIKQSSMIESSRNALAQWNRGSSINHVQLGNLTPVAGGTMAKAANLGHFPRSVQPVGHPFSYLNVNSRQAVSNNSFPDRSGLQTIRGGTFNSAAGGSFPKRLGLQPYPSGPSRMAEGNLQQSQNSGLVDYFGRPVTQPFVIGPPPAHFNAQDNPLYPPVSSAPFPVYLAPRINQFRPSLPSDQVVPVAKLDVKPQASPPIVNPSSLKRKATENTPVVRLGQRRRPIPQPAPPPHQRFCIPSAAQIPTAPLHVKWQGCDDPPKPTGQKCHLCKRDLSFTAEGPVFQPTAPPAVAVLPCGHTFHDHCLQNITPGDQAKNPPCIPCAIGES